MATGFCLDAAFRSPPRGSGRFAPRPVAKVCYSILHIDCLHSSYSSFWGAKGGRSSSKYLSEYRQFAPIIRRFLGQHCRYTWQHYPLQFGQDKCQGKGRKEKKKTGRCGNVVKEYTWKYPRSRHALVISSTTRARVGGSRLR